MAYSFAGGNNTNRIAVTYSTAFTAFTCLATVQATGYGGGGFGRIFDRSSGASGNEFNFFINSAISQAGNQPGLGFTRQYPFGAPNWYHADSTLFSGFPKTYRIALSHSGDSSVLPLLFVDGVQRTMVAAGSYSSASPSANTANLIIGNRANTTSNRSWQGWIAEFALYNTQIDSKLLDAYSSGWSPANFLPNRIIYLPLVRDAVDRHKNTVTVTGATSTSSHPSMFNPSQF